MCGMRPRARLARRRKTGMRRRLMALGARGAADAPGATSENSCVDDHRKCSDSSSATVSELRGFIDGETVARELSSPKPSATAATLSVL